MNNESTLPVVAVLTRLFPNIVQTYILNHIISLINSGIRTVIVAERDPRQPEVNPAVAEYRLRDKTLYARTELSTLATQRGNKQYRNMLRKLIFSTIWTQLGPKYTLKALPRARAISDSNCNLIHSHSLFSTYNFLFTRKYLSAPLITTYHGMVPRGVNKLDEHKMLRAIEATDIFIVNTEFAKSELVELGCAPEKIRIIPQGTDIARFPYSKRMIVRQQPIRLLTVARLSIEKGHHTALQAIATLIGEFPEIEYHIVGHGPEKANLKKLASKLGIEKHVIMHDFMTGNELKQQFSSAHIFILPSINFRDGYLVETQGVVLQEAQASGVPVIGSSAGGIPDVINDKETGLVFEQENHEQLAEKIRILINDEQLYQGLCIAGRRDVEERFSTNIVCDQLISVYEEILGTAVKPD